MTPASCTELPAIETTRTNRIQMESMWPAKPDAQVVLGSMSDAQLKDYANAAFWNDLYAPAQSAMSLLIKHANCSEKKRTHECFELEMNTAILDLQMGHLKSAKTRLLRLLPEVKDTNSNGGMDDPDCQFFIAECEYRDGKFKESVVSYKRALTLYRKILPTLSPDLAPAIEGLAGCYYRKRDFALIKPLDVELAQIDLATRGPDDLRFAWSLMNLADIEHKLGNDADRKTLFETAVCIFRKVNQDRIMAKLKVNSNDSNANRENATLQATLKSSIFGNIDEKVVASNKAKSLALLDRQSSSVEPGVLLKRPFDFYNWRFKRSQKVDTPGFVIVDPTVPLRGLIVCVHGLGLHHRSYEEFGARISKLGYGIVSFDMRGFGGYKDEKGYDLVDLTGCVEDLGNIIKLFRRDYPTTSLFLLGESMGGAIALHVAAKYQNELQGLVSSVPAGSRYKGKRTDFKVALKLVHGKNQQFDIGNQVVDQATHDAALRKEWKDDPSARMNLSASELVKFQKFMNQNERLAKGLKTLPVIIFQGFGDKLVKPEGTLALYNALGTKYKNLELIGHQEHLIFEEGQCPPEVMDGLLGWLNNHRLKKSTTAVVSGSSNSNATSGSGTTTDSSSKMFDPALIGPDDSPDDMPMDNIR